MDIVHTKSVSDETVTFSSFTIFEVLIKPPKCIAVSPEPKKKKKNSNPSELENYEYDRYTLDEEQCISQFQNGQSMTKRAACFIFTLLNYKNSQIITRFIVFSVENHF